MRTSPALRWASKSLWSYNPIPTGCVLHLPFWDPALHGSPTIKSIDLYGHSCTRTGGVMSDKGFTVDGNDYISLPAGKGLTPATGTIMFWAEFDRLDTGERLYSSNVNELSVYHNGGGALRFYYDGVVEAEYDPISVTVNTYYLFAYAFTQGGSAYQYQNGVQKGTSAISATAPTEATPKIGSDSAGTGQFFSGTYGEFGIWDVHLTVEQILHYYHNTMGRYV